MQLRSALFLSLLAASLPAVARAEIFVCRTASGATVTTDHLSSECRRYGGKELNPDGSVRRLILTPAQRAEQDAAAQQQRKAQELQRQKQREDRALLLRFPNRAAFEAAQQSDLQTPKSLIDSARKRLTRLGAERKELDQEAQFYPGGNYPLELRSKLEENKLLTQQEQSMIVGQEQAMARIRIQYTQQLPHLKTLWARQAADQASNAEPDAP